MTLPPTAEGPNDRRGAHAELRACRARSRAVADEGVHVQLSLNASRLEADNHELQRARLEKRMAGDSAKLVAAQAELGERVDQVAELEGRSSRLSSELETERIRVCELEKGALLAQRAATLSVEREDALRREAGAVMFELENCKMQLSMLSAGQDPRVIELRDNLSSFFGEQQKVFQRLQKQKLDDMTEVDRQRGENKAEVIIPHHETFSTAIQPPYSSTKGCVI
jgi:hypothetical protein